LYTQPEYDINLIYASTEIKALSFSIVNIESTKYYVLTYSRVFLVRSCGMIPVSIFGAEKYNLFMLAEDDLSKWTSCYVPDMLT